MVDEPGREELEAAHCWEPGDRVPGRPAMTAFRRRARLHQARWREAHGHPMGTQPIVPRAGKAARPVGSLLSLDYARESGANFVTPNAFAAARDRAATKEPHQSVDHQRLWADLLWRTAFACNLFGDLASDVALADHAVHTCWPDVPGTATAVRFDHSPGWLDPSYTGNLISLDAAVALERPDGSRAVLGFATEYHDFAKREVPKPERLARYAEVADRSGAFAPGALEAVLESNLLVMWLQHLLVCSMVQHPTAGWSWGRFVLVHPEGNADYAGAATWYRSLLRDDSTFASITVEDLLERDALPARSVRALRERYVVD